MSLRAGMCPICAAVGGAGMGGTGVSIRGVAPGRVRKSHETPTITGSVGDGHTIATTRRSRPEILAPVRGTLAA